MQRLERLRTKKKSGNVVVSAPSSTECRRACGTPPETVGLEKPRVKKPPLYIADAPLQREGMMKE